jgi:glutamine cyclotransferase
MLRLADQHFGEGITILGDKLLQLTWQSHVGFVYRKDTFTPLREFTYTGEGWGLTHDGRRLILSDGTATLRFLDPNTYAETGRIEVRDQGRPVERLNELEFVADGPLVGQSAWRGRPALASRGHPDLALPGQDTSMAYEVQGPGSPNAIRSRLGTHDALATKEQGRDALATKGTLPQAEGGNGLLYANIWPTDRIAIIDPKTGRVTGWIDLSGLYTPRANEQGDSVLNGIAYLPKTRHLLVTGKLWPRLYEIELIPQPQGKHDR